MRIALALARRGLGTVSPNPAVGCVIAQNQKTVARGWTQPGGRPHAEAEALARAGEAARGATAYVTLEPCAHRGLTPPCADALIAAGIARAVIAVIDPDPRVSGQGLERLRQAGMAVECGLLDAEAHALNAGFFCRVLNHRPLVTVKLATTLDGRVATRTGASQWITGEAARRRAHLMRAEFDAIMIGSGTMLADDPRLTCRLAGLEHRSPVRVVLDGNLRLPPNGQLCRSAGEVPLWCLTRSRDAEAIKGLERLGVDIIQLPATEAGYMDLAQVMEALGKRGVTRLMVEGGSGLVTALGRAGLIDEIVWFRAPTLAGGDALPVFSTLGIDRLDAMLAFKRLKVETVGQDLLETYAIPT